MTRLFRQVEETRSFNRRPRQHHTHMNSTQMLERLNEEINRLCCCSTYRTGAAPARFYSRMGTVERGRLGFRPGIRACVGERDRLIVRQHEQGALLASDLVEAGSLIGHCQESSEG